jgi:hypothetical protein
MKNVPESHFFQIIWVERDFKNFHVKYLIVTESFFSFGTNFIFSISNKKKLSLQRPSNIKIESEVFVPFLVDARLQNS